MAFELEVLAKKVDRFGWDRDRNTPAQDRLVMDWMDALSDFALEEVRAACRRAILDNPNKCPNEGHVRKLIEMERNRIAKLHKQPEPKQGRREPTAEEKARVARIVRDAGFGMRQ